MKPGVVLLGRRRGAVRAARRLGLRALVVKDGAPGDDPDARTWSRPFRDPDAMAALVPELLSVAPVRAVIATTEGSVVPAARLRAALGVDGMDVATAVRCTDKAVMKSAVRAAGVACADVVTPDDGLDRDGLVARLGLPLVVKARSSSGSRGLSICREVADVPDRIDDGWMAESWVGGVEMSVESVVVDGEPVFENPTEYLRPGWANVVPAALDDALWQRVRDVDRSVIRALGIRGGVTHLEVFVDGDRVTFGEIAARPPGGHLMDLIARVYGFDPWEALLRTAVREPVEVATTPRGAAGVWLFHPGPGRVRSVQGAALAREMPGVADLVLRVAPGDDVGRRVGVGQEVGHVVVTGADRDETAARLEAAHAAVRIEVE